MRACAVALALFATLSISPAAQAATFCVGTPAELAQALTSAAGTAADDEIRIRTGTYSAPQTLVYNATTAGWLYLSGGWQAGCTTQSLNAHDTVLDGGGQRQIMVIQYLPGAAPPAVPRFLVSNLSFRNGMGATNVRGGGLNFFTNSQTHVELFIDNVVFADNTASWGGALAASVSTGVIRVVNSLFMNNAAPTTSFGHAALGATSTPSLVGILVMNSTFVNGTCLGNTGGARGCGIGINVGAGARADVLNSVFHNNAITDITPAGLAGELGSGTVNFSYSLVPEYHTTIMPNISNPITAAPGFVDPANNDFRLRDDSALIDRGLATVPLYSPLTYDLDGNLRTFGSAMDVGAFEKRLDAVFRNGFEQSGRISTR